MSAQVGWYVRMHGRVRWMPALAASLETQLLAALTRRLGERADILPAGDAVPVESAAKRRQLAGGSYQR